MKIPLFAAPARLDARCGNLRQRNAARGAVKNEVCGASQPSKSASNHQSCWVVAANGAPIGTWTFAQACRSYKRASIWTLSPEIELI